MLLCGLCKLFFFIYFIVDVTIAVTNICNILCSQNIFFMKAFFPKVPEVQLMFIIIFSIYRDMQKKESTQPLSSAQQARELLLNSPYLKRFLQICTYKYRIFKCKKSILAQQ